MKIVSWIVGALGILVLLAAVYGRFHAAPTITISGQRFLASTFLTLGNTLLLLGLFIAAIAAQMKKS